jgi:NTE family protein
LSLVNLYSALGSQSPALQSLGGLFKLSGHEPGSIAGRYGGAASLVYLFRLGRLSPGIGDGIYIGGSVEAGNLWMDQAQVNSSDLLFAGSVCIGIDTALGPLYFAQGFGEGGADALYLYVGRSF